MKKVYLSLEGRNSLVSSSIKVRSDIYCVIYWLSEDCARIEHKAFSSPICSKMFFEKKLKEFSKRLASAKSVRESAYFAFLKGEKNNYYDSILSLELAKTRFDSVSRFFVL